MQKNAVLSLVAVIALAVAGYLAFSTSTSQALPSEYSAYAWSFGSNQEVQITYDPSEHDPYTCPISNTKTAYLLYYCNNCEHKVVPKLTNKDGAYRIVGYAKCPNCGSGNLTPYDPALMPEAKDAELTLPKEHP